MMARKSEKPLNTDSTIKRIPVLSILILLCVGIFIFACSNSILWIGDDWRYGYIWGDGMDPQHIDNPTPVHDLGDVVISQINHYSTTNGRVMAHTLVQSVCGIWGQTVFSFLNACMYICFILLLMNLCGMKFNSVRATVSATAIILLSFATRMGPSTQIGYIWGAVFVLIFLKLFFAKKEDNICMLALLFMLAICVGNSHEAYSISISVALIIYWCFNMRKFTKRQWVMMIGFGMGTLIICLSPAAYSRASIEHKPLSQTLFFFFTSLRAAYILIAVVIYQLLRHKNTLRNVYRGNSFLWNVIFVSVVFNLAIGVFCNRQLFGIELMSAIILFRIVPKHSFNTFWSWTFGLLTIGFCYLHAERIYLQNSQLKSIESQYMISEDGIVYQDVADVNLFTDVSYSPHLWDTGFHGPILKRIMKEKYPGHKPLVLVPSYMKGKMHENLGNTVYYFKYKPGKLLCIQSKSNPKKFIVTRKFFGIIPYQQREMDFSKPYFETDSMRAIIYDELNPVVLNTDVRIY